MDHFFEEIYSGVIDKRDRIGEILTTHGLAMENTAFVGDMVHDIETAHHGEIASVAVTTGYDPEARLRKAEPKHLFHDLTAFREWLEANPSQT